MVGPSTIFEFQEEGGPTLDKKNDLKSNAVIKTNSNLSRPSGSAQYVRNPVNVAGAHLIVTSGHNGAQGSVSN